MNFHDFISVLATPLLCRPYNRVCVVHEKRGLSGSLLLFFLHAIECVVHGCGMLNKGGRGGEGGGGGGRGGGEEGGEGGEGGGRGEGGRGGGFAHPLRIRAHPSIIDYLYLWIRNRFKRLCT